MSGYSYTSPLAAEARAPLREFVPPLIVVWRRPCGMAHFSLRLITQSVGTIENAMKQGADSHLQFMCIG